MRQRLTGSHQTRCPLSTNSQALPSAGLLSTCMNLQPLPDSNSPTVSFRHQHAASSSVLDPITAVSEEQSPQRLLPAKHWAGQGTMTGRLLEGGALKRPHRLYQTFLEWLCSLRLFSPNLPCVSAHSGLICFVARCFPSLL